MSSADTRTPWDTNTWEELEEELADISPTVRVQWESASLTYTVPPQFMLWSALQQNVNESWNTYDGYNAVWKPPAQRRREGVVTPWNVKAPRLSSTIINKEAGKAVVEVLGLSSYDAPPLEAVRVPQDAGLAKRKRTRKAD